VDWSNVVIRIGTAYLLAAVVSALLLAAGAPSALAEEEWAEEGRNELGVYLGVTSSGDDEGVSLGIDYERRLSLRFGIGGVVEYTGADFREGLVAASFDWHPWRELKLFAAPGVAIETAEHSSEALLRLSGEYAFVVGRGFEVAPGIAFDFTDTENSVVIGAVFAKKF